MKKNLEDSICNSLLSAIEEKDRHGIFMHTDDFISNVSSGKKEEFIENLVKNKILSESDFKEINKLMRKTDENDLVMLVSIIFQGGGKDKILSDGMEIVSDIRNDLRENVSSNIDLFKSAFTNYKYSELKEAVGWVAGFVETASEKSLEKVAYYENNQLNQKRTLKNILSSINKLSLVKSFPFKNQPSKDEKLELNIISFCLDYKGGVYSKKAKLPSMFDCLDLIENDKHLKDKFKKDYLDSHSNKVIERALLFVKNSPIWKIEKKVSGITDLKFNPAGSGEVDVMLYNEDSNKVLGMSVTSDQTTYIEQNQFFRHALKTLIISNEIEKKYPNGCTSKQARNVTKDLEIEIKIKKEPFSYKKPIDQMKFNELLRYYRQENDLSVNSIDIISKEEMNYIINNMKKKTQFIFYGESSGSVRERGLKEEFMGHLMLSYVGNLKSYGNIETDYLSAFNFLNECVDAKFNSAENDKNYIMRGLINAVNFVNIGGGKEAEKYNEGRCYKNERELLYGSVKSLLLITKEMIQNDKNDFSENINNFLTRNGVSKEKSNKFIKKITSPEFKSGLELKIKGIKKGESETYKEVESLLSIAENINLHIQINTIKRQHQKNDSEKKALSLKR